MKKGEVELSKTIKVTKPANRIIGNDGRPFPKINQKIFSMNAKISLASLGEIIGDDDVINDAFRSMTCRCYSSMAELLEISKTEFKRRIRSEDSLNQLTERKISKDCHMKSAISLLKVIKEPKIIRKVADEDKGKKILDGFRSLNPWNSAQNLFGKKKEKLPQDTKKHSEIMKKAIQTVATCRSQPLSPKFFEHSLISKSTILSPKKPF